jgi:hypothetical protein
MFGVRIVPKKYMPLVAAMPVKPVVASDYIDVAQRMVMARDRNPNVIIDPEPAKPKPPLPPLPVAHGLMMLGEPGLIMSDKSGVQKTYHPGDKIGPFKLVAFDSIKVVFDWDGEKVERKLEELLEKGATADSGNPVAAPAAAAPPPAASNPIPLGPGPETGGGYRACQPNDSMPAGTVMNGVKKVVTVSPFGRACAWEPVNK